jgi:hypothetical protein
VAADVHVERRRLAAQHVIVTAVISIPFWMSFVMTGAISVCSSTRSPIAMACPCMGLNATQPPSASAGLWDARA